MSKGTVPTEQEVDAVEKVIAAFVQEPVDGYWRGCAREALEAAAEVRVHPADLLAQDASIEQVRQAVAAHRFDAALGEGRC